MTCRVLSSGILLDAAGQVDLQCTCQNNMKAANQHFSRSATYIKRSQTMAIMIPCILTLLNLTGRACTGT